MAEKSRKIPKNFKTTEEAFGFREAIINPAPASGGPIGPADATTPRVQDSNPLGSPD